MTNRQSKEMKEDAYTYLEKLPENMEDLYTVLQNTLSQYLQNKQICHHIYSDKDNGDTTVVYMTKYIIKHGNDMNKWKYVYIWLPSIKNQIHVCIGNWKKANMIYVNTVCYDKYDFAPCFLEIVKGIGCECVNRGRIHPMSRL